MTKTNEGKTHKKWMKLDNAAKIYPAAKRRKWKALFRVSVILTEKIDPDILEVALKSTLSRYPTFSMKLKRGLFWYYMEHNDAIPQVRVDGAYPCAKMDFNENDGFMFRVLYYNRRIAIEIFHSLTDGYGGLSFLSTLVAEYLTIKYGEKIPRNDIILDCSDEASPEEIEDAFLKYARGVVTSRSEADSFHFRGTNEPDDFVNTITGLMPVKEVLAKAKEKNVSLNEYLTAVLIVAIDKLQRRAVSREEHYKPIKICVPINLRNFYPTKTIRNFSSYVNIGIDPRFGLYSFDEVLSSVHHGMRLAVTEKVLNAKISTNVRAEAMTAIRFAPLFLKNIVMKASFNRLGDRKSTTNISNLGVVKLPPEMEKYVERMDLIVGPLSINKVVCAAITYKDTLVINFIRTIQESDLEREFFRELVKQGIPVKLESNKRNQGASENQED